MYKVNVQRIGFLLSGNHDEAKEERKRGDTS